MTNERDGKQMLERRKHVQETFPIPEGFVANVLANGFQTIVREQIELIRTRPIQDHLTEIADRLKAQGYRGEPSETRIRAEHLAQIAGGWLTFADSRYEDGDLLTYVFFADLSAGASSVAGTLIAADDLNSQDKMFDDEKSVKVSQVVTESSDQTDTGSSIDLYLHLQELAKKNAELLAADPSGFRLAGETAKLMATPKEVDPFPTPFITEFAEAGAQLGVIVLDEIRKRQEAQS